MTTATAVSTESNQQIATVFQYTVEAYKVFEKLAENLPNAISAATFKNFAEDERAHRDLLELKYLSVENSRIPLTLGNDLRFQDMIEGDLSNREICELLIARERTIERKLNEWSKSSSENDRNLFHYIAAAKRSHVALLERELELIRRHANWFEREDAEDVIVHGVG